MFADAEIKKQGNNYHVSYGSDAGCYVEFSSEAIEDAEKSIEEGRPIFKDVDFVTIRFAGDKNTIVKRPVKKIEDAHGPADAVRWPRQWMAYKNQQTQTHEGTPINEWPPISKAMALELKAMNIHTVEMLSEVSDANLSWMGARAMRDKAKAWIDQAKGGAGLSKLQAENDALRADLEAMKAQIAALGVAEEKRGRGRPKKDVEDDTNPS